MESPKRRDASTAWSCLQALLVMALAWTSCSRCTPASEPQIPARVLHAGRADEAPVIDGKLTEALWREAATTGAFSATTGDGGVVVAHAEARAAWDSTALYVAVYVGDESIDREDLLSFEVNGHRWALAPADAGLDGIRWAIDTDGTVDDPSDDDEEWVLELAIPWSALGLEGAPAQVTADFFRNDRPKDSTLRSMRWNTGEKGPGVIMLDRR
jgi:Carbohydrate family 9 binding domain-like